MFFMLIGSETPLQRENDFAEETIMAKILGGRQRYGTSTDTGILREAGIMRSSRLQTARKPEQKARAEAVDMVILTSSCRRKHVGMPGPAEA